MQYSRLIQAFLFLPLLAGPALSQAQTALPYTTGFDTEAQKAGWQQFKKGVTGTYHWTYEDAGPYSAPTRLAHNYPVGGSDTTKDWYVSPAFNLPAGGRLDSLRYAFNGFGVPNEGDTVAIYLLKGNADPALASSRTLLYDFRGDDYVADNAWRKLDTISLPATSGSCYIAFYYRTVSNWLDVRFDNLGISGKQTTGIGGVSLRDSDVLLYPNPAETSLHLVTDRHFNQTRIYDLGGKLLYHGPFRNTVSVAELPTGTYIIECSTVSGIQWKQSFVRR